ncbi:collagen, type I, alpha 1b-like [Pongo pygmaeus]|uniref:collagen, type I, alpha 1b-like n=1 Tax=Pongo pygmaeus TaxID=9600 RepID=UPI00300C5788
MVTFRGAGPQTWLARAICAAPAPARFRPAAPVSGSRSAASRRPPAAGRTASQSAAARGSMPAGAPPPLGRMAQAGRPAGAHILRPGRGARGPLRGRHSEGGGEAGRVPALSPRSKGLGSRGFALRGGEEGGRRRCRSRVWGDATREDAGFLRAAGSGGSARSSAADRRHSSCPGAPSERSLCRRPRPGGWQEAGTGGARGEGAVERGAWGRAAAAPRGGGARGSRGPAARAHRARRRASRALSRLPPRVCLSARSPPPPGAGPNSARPARLTSPAFPAPRTELEPPARPRLLLAAPPCGGRGRRGWGARCAQQGRQSGRGLLQLPSLSPVASRSPPCERLERGRRLRLDRRAPPDGVARVTGWHVKPLEVPTRLRGRPVDPESYFGEAAAPKKDWVGAHGAGAARKVSWGGAEPRGPRGSVCPRVPYEGLLCSAARASALMKSPRSGSELQRFCPEPSEARSYAPDYPTVPHRPAQLLPGQALAPEESLESSRESGPPRLSTGVSLLPSHARTPLCLTG